jgi:hypothetical protein
VPTYDAVAAFLRDWQRMDGESRARFMSVVMEFVKALRVRPPVFPPRLRVHKVGDDPTLGPIWSLSWGYDSRALFVYGAEVRPGDPHVIWIAIGTHDVYR